MQALHHFLSSCFHSRTTLSLETATTVTSSSDCCWCLQFSCDLQCSGVEFYSNRIKEANPDIKLGTMALSSETIGRAVLIGGCNCGFAVNSFTPNKQMAMDVVGKIATVDGQRALWSDRQGSQTYLKNVVFDNPEEFDEIRSLTSTDRVVMPWNEWGSRILL